MEILNSIYLELLRLGLPRIQLAFYSQNKEWLRAEIEFLHNIPSLIGETNGLRHEYFWSSERALYWEAIDELDEEIQHGSRTHYAKLLESLYDALVAKGYVGAEDG